MKKYLYQKWAEEIGVIEQEKLIIESEFRERGCPTCGPAKENKGGWSPNGGYLLVCPHLKKYVNNKLKKKISQHQKLLQYIFSNYPQDAMLLLNQSNVSKT